MDSCCQSQYDHTFDSKYARTNLENYRSNGIKKNSRKLLRAIQELELSDYSILEIGAGAGAMIFELLESGAKEATNVDISRANLEVFDEEVARRGLDSVVSSHWGDFLAIQDTLANVDIVIMDKVICCYENYQDLVAKSASKSDKWYAFSMPRHTWWVQAVSWVDNVLRRWKGRPFQTFVHPVSEVYTILEEQGFRKVSSATQREWLVAIFERPE